MSPDRITFAGRILLLCLCAASHDALAEPTKSKLDCADPFISGPAAVKHILGGLYRAEADKQRLIAAAAALQELAATVTYCRIWAQSPSSGSNRRTAAEWVSLFQWVNRLADFVSLQAQGDDRADWKGDYAVFAELYEFES